MKPNNTPAIEVLELILDLAPEGTKIYDYYQQYIHLRDVGMTNNEGKDFYDALISENVFRSKASIADKLEEIIGMLTKLEATVYKLTSTKKEINVSTSTALS